VIVLGGGLAGITAALDCADAGAQVTLLEVRPRLGGAAYSFKRESLWLDNGQHVFLRCCSAYRALLARLGSESCTRIQPRLEIPVLSPDGRRVVLRRGRLPAPLHLAGALMRYSHLSPAQRLGVARAGLALGRLDSRRASERERVSREAFERSLVEQATPVLEHATRAVEHATPVLEHEGTAPGSLGEWLAEHGQSAAALAALWDLIALPTLNLPAAQASLALGAFVLRTGLLESKDAGDIGFHLRPLSETLGEPAWRVLAEAGVEVRLRARVERVSQVQERLCVSVGGVELQAEAVISAVPHQRAAGLLSALLGAQTRDWMGLGASPIVNVHIVYDRRVCELGFAAGVGTPVQYLFDRSDAAGLSDGQYLAISLSGATREMRLSSEQLCERYVGAMRELFPRARGAVVRDVYVSREHAATFAGRPGTEALRPDARTGVPGLALAGAWTNTGWPATLEGAVLSGHAAAREVLGR
jgi:squalene-associated FAD-dependent desaturase